MNKKQFTLIAAAFLMMVLMAAPNFAAGCQKKIPLSITAAGFAIDSSGVAEVRARDARQVFKVSMDARVADGTTFFVSANGLPAGAITITLGGGELSLSNSNGQTLPSGVDPVCKIGLVEVKDGSGTVVLNGNF